MANLDEATRLEEQELQLLKDQVASLSTRVWGTHRTHQEIEKAAQKDREKMTILMRQRQLMLKRKESAMLSFARGAGGGSLVMSPLNRNRSSANMASPGSPSSSLRAKPSFSGIGMAMELSGSDDDDQEENSAAMCGHLAVVLHEAAQQEATERMAVPYNKLCGLRLLFGLAHGNWLYPDEDPNNLAADETAETAQIKDRCLRGCDDDYSYLAEVLENIQCLKRPSSEKHPELLFKAGNGSAAGAIAKECNDGVLTQLVDQSSSLQERDGLVVVAMEPRVLKWNGTSPSLVSVKCRSAVPPSRDLAADVALVLFNMTAVAKDITTAAATAAALSGSEEGSALAKVPGSSLIGFNRVPLREGIDDNVHTSDSKHVIVIYKSYMHALDVINDRNAIFDPITLAKRIKSCGILDPASHNATPAAFLSLAWGFDKSIAKLEKQDWYDTRTEILSSREETATLTLLESALFVLNIDDWDDVLSRQDDEETMVMSEDAQAHLASCKATGAPYTFRHGVHPNNSRWYLNALNVSYTASSGSITLSTSHSWCEESAHQELNFVAQQLTDRLDKFHELHALESGSEEAYLYAQLTLCFAVLFDHAVHVPSTHVLRYLSLSDAPAHIDGLLRVCEDPATIQILENGRRALLEIHALQPGGDVDSKSAFRKAMSVFGPTRIKEVEMPLPSSQEGTDDAPECVTAIDVEVFNFKLPPAGSDVMPTPTYRSLEFFVSSSSVAATSTDDDDQDERQTKAYQMTKKHYKKRLYVCERVLSGGVSTGVHASNPWLQRTTVNELALDLHVNALVRIQHMTGVTSFTQAARCYGDLLLAVTALHLHYNVKDPVNPAATIPIVLGCALGDSSSPSANGKPSLPFWGRALCTTQPLVDMYREHLLPFLIGGRPNATVYTKQQAANAVECTVKFIATQHSMPSSHPFGSPVAHAAALEAAASMEKKIELSVFRDSSSPLCFVTQPSTQAVMSWFCPDGAATLTQVTPSAVHNFKFSVGLGGETTATTKSLDAQVEDAVGRLQEQYHQGSKSAIITGQPLLALDLLSEVPPVRLLLCGTFPLEAFGSVFQQVVPIIHQHLAGLL